MKKSDRALSLRRVGVAILLLSIFTLIWTIPLNLFWYSIALFVLSIVEMGIVSSISNKFDEKQQLYLSNISKSQKEIDNLEKKEFFKLKEKLQKEYNLYDKLCEELNT
ncbi:MAG: hypothetical protein J6Q58_04395 [Clostridia bacterium]|nr:hypothetical protein [Clostridia bacterium]